MRARFKRLTAAMVALLVSAAAGLTVANSAAANHNNPDCDGKEATIVVNQAHQWGTSGDDVVVIQYQGAWYYPNGGSDTICIDTWGATVDATGTSPGHDILGSNGPDRIYGSEGDDYINGAGNEDRIWGYGGADVIYGGDGMDLIYGDDGDDEIHGGSGHDCLVAGHGGNNSLFGDAGHDTLLLGYDSIYRVPTPANPRCSPAPWDQSTSATNFLWNPIYGGGTARGGGGDDWAFGSNSDDFLQGYGGDDYLIGYGGNDNIQGGGGADTLSGGWGTDELFATSNFVDSDGVRDLVMGGGGDGDTMDGQNGEDWCAPDWESSGWFWCPLNE